MTRKPFLDFWVFVRGVIIHNDVYVPVFWRRPVYGVQKADEFLMPVALHVLTDHCTVENIQGGEKGCCSMAFIIMRHRLPPPFFERQARLSSVERLDLALLVNAEHNRMVRRINVKSDHIVQFFCKFRVIRQFERLHLMRRKTMHYQIFCTVDGASPISSAIA